MLVTRKNATGPASLKANPSKERLKIFLPPSRKNRRGRQRYSMNVVVEVLRPKGQRGSAYGSEEDFSE